MEIHLWNFVNALKELVQLYLFISIILPIIKIDKKYNREDKEKIEKELVDAITRTSFCDETKKEKTEEYKSRLSEQIKNYHESLEKNTLPIKSIIYSSIFLFILIFFPSIIFSDSILAKHLVVFIYLSKFLYGIVIILVILYVFLLTMVLVNFFNVDKNETTIKQFVKKSVREIYDDDQQKVIND